MAQSLYRILKRRFDRRQPDISRREMLRITLAGTAGALLSNTLGCAPSAPASSRTAARQASGPRVIVIGGGFSGLAAAYELLAAKYDVQLFESRKRFGGRVLTFK